MIFLFICILLNGCSQDPLEQKRQEGKEVTRTLVKDLKKVRTRDDLLVVAPALEKHFVALAQTMLAARKVQKGEKHEFSADDHALSEELRVEINRIFQLEGGRAVIEKAQQPALAMLNG